MGSPNPAKQVLRKKIKEIIKNIPFDEKAKQSANIIAKTLEHPAYKTANKVSLYLSTADEVNTIPILRDLFKQHKQVFVPTYRKNEMQMVQLRDLSDFETLPFTKWNIKQPNPDGRVNCLETGLDLIIMPGVAFTMSGARMGHGMGYYDNFLNRFFQIYPRNGTMLLGIAFREQVIQDLPIDSHDIQLDQIVTSDKFIKVSDPIY